MLCLLWPSPRSSLAKNQDSASDSTVDASLTLASSVFLLPLSKPQRFLLKPSPSYYFNKTQTLLGFGMQPPCVKWPSVPLPVWRAAAISRSSSLWQPEERLSGQQPISWVAPTSAALSAHVFQESWGPGWPEPGCEDVLPSS